MNHWPFIAGAYAVTLVGLVGALLLSQRAMARAEAQARVVPGR